MYRIIILPSIQRKSRVDSSLNEQPSSQQNKFSSTALNVNRFQFQPGKIAIDLNFNRFKFQFKTRKMQKKPKRCKQNSVAKKIQLVSMPARLRYLCLQWCTNSPRLLIHPRLKSKTCSNSNSMHHFKQPSLNRMTFGHLYCVYVKCQTNLNRTAPQAIDL